MGFIKKEIWQCEQCGAYPTDLHMSKCPNTDCPSNKPKETMQDKLLKWAEASELGRGGGCAEYLYLASVIRVAGKDGVIIAWSKGEIETLRMSAKVVAEYGRSCAWTHHGMAAANTALQAVLNKIEKARNL